MKKYSDLINSQSPFFVRNSHPAFVDFVEAYYEFLEQNGNLIDRSNDILDYHDVDKTIAEFSDHLYNTFLQAIPKDILASKEILIKNIKDFYRSKGTEKSLKFLLRILFDEESTVYYPKLDVLKYSDGKWYIQKSLRVSNTTINGISNTEISGLEIFLSRRIKGQLSNSSATVERVDRFYDKGLLIDEFVLSNIDGQFDSGEKVVSYFVENDNIIFANTYINAGVVTGLQIIKSGKGYSLSDPITFESDSGSGAAAKITKISTGNVSSIHISTTGAGFLVNDSIIISGGGGTDAEAHISQVSSNNHFHPNNYILYTTTIQDMAGTLISDSLYPNLSNLIVSSPNANSSMIDTLNTFSYGPCGPLENIIVTNPGDGYSTQPILFINSNPLVRSTGILGRMEILSPGLGYVVGDTIEFIGGSGIGAQANVTSVNVSGSIETVNFVAGETPYIGGYGYSQSDLPIANVVSSTGSGANILVTSIVGDGADIQAITGVAGSILEISLLSEGSGYLSEPTINMSSYGDGTAVIQANVTQGVYTYPGRFLNDDGFLSSTKYLQDRDYYQNFSYVVKLSKSIDEYKQVLLALVHPTGTKLFGIYEKVSII